MPHQLVVLVDLGVVTILRQLVVLLGYLFESKWWLLGRRSLDSLTSQGRLLSSSDATFDQTKQDTFQQLEIGGGLTPATQAYRAKSDTRSGR